MNDEVRSGTQSVDDIHITNVPQSFRAFAEEVHKRTQKPKASPLTIAQKLLPAEFNMAMVHFYRGEVQRSNVWRTRLDATTNWAVITAGGTLAVRFRAPGNSAFAIPLNTVRFSIFLFSGAGRYPHHYG